MAGKEFFGTDRTLAERDQAHKTTNSSEQSRLVTHKDVLVRIALATNRNASTDILTRLSKDADWGVRAAVAKNPSTSASVKKVLANDSNFFVRGATNASR